MSATASEIQARLAGVACDACAGNLRRFFKTGPGQYGEGDRFRGIRVPVLRHIGRDYRQAPLDEIAILLDSGWHEDRMLALILLVHRYGSSDEAGREAVYRFYCSGTAKINNWDLVDASAPHIVGRHLFRRDRSPLIRFAGSESLWERRIAIVSTFHFIRAGEFADTLAITASLLHDPEELIHKACGWMLREVGKRDTAALERFLREHHRGMPRVMLRYAIERFPEPLRKSYLQGIDRE